jgi:hypothetical protein
MEKLGKNAEKKEFGRNVHAVLEFLRHATPGKNPDGTSADFITPGGQEMAKQLGKERPKEKKLGGYSSPAKRAQETGDLYLDNADDSIGVVNRTITEINETRLAEAMKPGKKGGKLDLPAQREGNVFRMKTRNELAPLAFGKIIGFAKVYAKQQKENGSKLDDLTLMIQYYLDNPKKCEEVGLEVPHEAATQIAERVAVELGMTERFYADSDVRLINVTHGPKLEPFLKEVVGFDRLEEIGGAVKEGENIQFVVDIDADKNKKVTLVFRGKEYELDAGQIKHITDMSKEYRDKLKAKKQE